MNAGKNRSVDALNLYGFTGPVAGFTSKLSCGAAAGARRASYRKFSGGAACTCMLPRRKAENQTFPAAAAGVKTPPMLLVRRRESPEARSRA